MQMSDYAWRDGGAGKKSDKKRDRIIPRADYIIMAGGQSREFTGNE